MKIIFDCGSTKTSVAIISSDSPTLHLDLANGYNALTGGDNELRTLISSHPTCQTNPLLWCRMRHPTGMP